MTREEAITLIKSAQLMLINPTTKEPVSDLHMALEMAISALEQVTKVRKAVMEIIKAHMDGEDKNTKAVLSDVMESVRETFEQEPCDKCVYSTKDGYCQYDDISETIPPLESCTDAVSREAVKEALRNRTGESISECINAIPPINLQPCDDAISRDAVLDLLATRVPNPYYENVFRAVDELPPVTQTPKYWIDKDNKIYKMPDDIPIMTSPLEQMINSLSPITQKSGKWIYEEVTRYEEDGDTVRSYADKKCKCSACGYDYGYQRMKDPFCRYCGARMESEDKE